MATINVAHLGLLVITWRCFVIAAPASKLTSRMWLQRSRWCSLVPNITTACSCRPIATAAFKKVRFQSNIFPTVDLDRLATFGQVPAITKAASRVATSPKFASDTMPSSTCSTIWPTPSSWPILRRRPTCATPRSSCPWPAVRLFYNSSILCRWILLPPRSPTTIPKLWLWSLVWKKLSSTSWCSVMYSTWPWEQPLFA